MNRALFVPGGIVLLAACGPGSKSSPCTSHSECNQPPAATCADEQRLTAYRGPGLCKNGACEYPWDTVECPDGCVNNRCANNPCMGIVCRTPPAPSCKDANTLSTHEKEGTCSEGNCSYTPVDVPCPLGCEDGRCKGDPCKDVTCDQPPTPCHQAVGLCSGGSCNYLFDDGASCDDQNPCTENDECSAGTCSGKLKVCDAPPANACKDATTLVVHDSQGICSGGTCNYGSQEIACPTGCDASKGACKGADPCTGVACNTPPSPCYENAGTCQNGKCTYAPADGKTCDDGNSCTEQDQCVSGACKGTAIVCNTAPARLCKDASTLTVFTTPGQCQNGKCSYGQADVLCTSGCKSGACQGDPCANVVCNTPPAGPCYSATGVCSGGTCSYLTTSGASCDDKDPCTIGDVCSGAICAGSPKQCTTPPPAKCTGELTLTTYANPGTCVVGDGVGACEYKATNQTCPGYCDMEINKCAAP
jgi:hypothetical protein